jgi:hypothetical protein
MDAGRNRILPIPIRSLWQTSSFILISHNRGTSFFPVPSIDDYFVANADRAPLTAQLFFHTQ